MPQQPRLWETAETRLLCALLLQDNKTRSLKKLAPLIKKLLHPHNTEEQIWKYMKALLQKLHSPVHRECDWCASGQSVEGQTPYPPEVEPTEEDHELARLMLAGVFVTSTPTERTDRTREIFDYRPDIGKLILREDFRHLSESQMLWCGIDAYWVMGMKEAASNSSIPYFSWQYPEQQHVAKGGEAGREDDHGDEMVVEGKGGLGGGATGGGEGSSSGGIAFDPMANEMEEIEDDGQGVEEN